MLPRFGPILVDAATGLAVGYMRNDDRANAGTRPTLGKQHGFWLEGGATALGLFAQMTNSNFLPHNVAETLVSHGVAFLSERFTRNQLSGGGAFRAAYPDMAPVGVSGRSVSGMPAYRGIPTFAGSSSVGAQGWIQREKSMGLI